MCVGVYLENRHVAFLAHFYLICFETESFTEPNAHWTWKTSWTASPINPPAYVSPVLGLQDCTNIPKLFMWWVMGSQVYDLKFSTASTLSFEPFPQV